MIHIDKIFDSVQDLFLFSSLFTRLGVIYYSIIGSIIAGIIINIIWPIFANIDIITRIFITSILIILILVGNIMGYIYKKSRLRKYLDKERDDIFKNKAPGSFFLKIGNIASGELFISPEWELYLGRKLDNELIPFLLKSIKEKKSILLLGEVGQGKTTIILSIFNKVIDLYKNNSLKILPIYIPLSSMIEFFSSNSNNDINEVFYDYLRKKVNNPIPMNKITFSKWIKRNKILFLFDGFDELFTKIDNYDIKLRTESNLLNNLSILSCRINFYEYYLRSSSIESNYPLIIRLLPLNEKSIKDFIPKYYSVVKNNNYSDLSNFDEQKMISFLTNQEKLLELSKRPLLLMMILDVFISPDTRNDYLRSINFFGITQLYKIYTEKWLGKESQKSISKLEWKDKDQFIEILAWVIYTSNTPYSSSYGHISENNMGFERLEIEKILLPFIQNYPALSLNDLCDDICLGSFLIYQYNNRYSFIHKSFFEYYVAKHIFSSFKIDGDNTSKSLRYSTPDDVARFIKGFINGSSNSDRSLFKIEENLKDAYFANGTNNISDQIIREHASYYLSCLNTPSVITFLKSHYQKEPDKLPQRGMIVGLIVNCHCSEMVTEYLNILEHDPYAAKINLTYTMAYYGDMPLESIYNSIKEYECTNAIQSLIKHLLDEKYILHWAIDLFTLRCIVIHYGISALKADSQNYENLKQFIDNNNPKESGVVREQQEKLLSVFN